MMPEPLSDKFVMVGQDRFLRVPVTATLKLADLSKVPDPLAKSVKAVASQMYWQDGANPDLLWVSFILDSEGANANWDYMPRPALAKRYATAKYKPFDMDHIVKEQGSLVYMDKYNAPPVKNTIFGVMTHTALADAEGNLLTDEQISKLELTDDPDRPINERLTVVAWAALYSFLFPKTVAHMVEQINSGNMKVSMERWIKEWDFAVVDAGGEPQAVARAEAEKTGVASAWSKHQPINGAPVLRRSNDFIYGGVASTTNPANAMCQFLDHSVVKAAASVTAADNNLKEFLTRHSEIHRLFAVSSDEDKKTALIDEHLKLTRAVAAYVGASGESKPNPEMSDVLDMTLPLDLQQIIGLDSEASPARAEAGAENPTNTNQSLEETMPNENTPASQPMTAEAIKQVVASYVTEIKGAADSQNALAGKIEGLVTDRVQAQAETTKVQAELAKANEAIAELRGKLEAAEAAKKKADDDKKKSDDEKDNFKKDKEKADASVIELTKKLNDITATQVIATRTESLKGAGFGDDKDMVAKATARKADGSFEIADDVFATQVSALKSAYEKGKASAGAATNVQAPANGVVPSAPDLTSAGLYAQGAAAVAAGGSANPTTNGKSQMAAAFPAE